MADFVLNLDRLSKGNLLNSCRCVTCIFRTVTDSVHSVKNWFVHMISMDWMDSERETAVYNKGRNLKKV